MRAAGSCARIIPLPPARIGLTVVERDEIARAQRAEHRRQERRRRALMQRRLAIVIAIGIVAGLLVAFMPWSGTSLPEETEQTAETAVSAPTALPLPSASSAAEEVTPTEAPFVPDAAEVEALAKMIWGEARGIASDTEKAACVWVVLNRVDDPRFPDTVIENLEAPYQFAGYSPDFPATDELKALAADVLTRYHAEKNGDTEAGRVLPSDYCWFTGDGEHNHFTNEWQSGDTWGWTLESPYPD